MKKKITPILIGLTMIAIGVGVCGDIAELWNFDLFFDGWWTLFIIIPSISSIVQHGFKLFNSIGLLFGVMFLLQQQDVIENVSFGKLLFPIFFIVCGILIIINAITNQIHFNKFVSSHSSNNTKYKTSKDSKNEFAVFGGSAANYNNLEYHGGNCSAVFGGVDLDLTNAIITEDCIIQCQAIFGGIDILLPKNVKLETSSVPIFGGIDNTFTSCPDVNAPTVYVNAFCMFGGVDIK